MESRTSNMLCSNQARIRALIAATTDVVYRMSPDWSEMWLLLGRDFLADTRVPTRDWLSKYIHPDDQMQVLAAIREAIRTKSVFELTHRILRIDGTPGWAFSRAVPLLEAKGEILEWIGLARSVAERMDMEQRLVERSNDLARLAAQIILLQHRERRRITEQLNEGLQQLLVAGLMKTRSLLSSTTFSTDGHLQELDQALSDAVESARSIARSLVPPVSLSDQLPDAFRWLANDVKEKHGLIVDAEISDELGVVTETTGVLLFTAAHELLMNVVEHSGTLDAELEIDREGERLTLVIRDHGKGFDASTTPEVGRDGFGLLSIEERVRLLGGRFAMQAARERGVEVQISIPDTTQGVDLMRGQSMPGLVQVTSDAGAWPANETSIPILIADDHTVVREALAKLLSEIDGLDVVAECGNGREAVEQVQRLRPAVAIMDVNMPVMDGVEATRLIKAYCPACKVIGLSVFSEAEGGHQMRSAGADAYLSKTAPPEELIDQIFFLAAGHESTELP